MRYYSRFGIYIAFVWLHVSNPPIIATNWLQLKYLLDTAGMTPEIRQRLEGRVKKLEEYDVLKASETKLSSSKESAALEQRRIKELMIALHREDELHAR